MVFPVGCLPVELSPKDLRASDEDRQSVADRLARAFTDGRLREAEYTDRLDSLYQASTYRELAALTLDLPGAGRRTARGRLPRRSRSGAGRRRMPPALAVLWTLLLIGVSVNTVVYGLVVLTSYGPVYPWPLWVAGPAGAALGAVTLGTRRYWRRDAPAPDAR